MATLSDLVKAIAEIQGLEENQVLWIARYLREDGLITQGGRGRGGAKMGARDAANLLIGINAPGTAKQSTHFVRAFRDLPLIRDFLSPEDITEWDDLRSEEDDDWTRSFYRLAPFGPALEQIINYFCEADNQITSDVTRITFSGPLTTASIYMGLEDAERAGDISLSVVFSAHLDSREPDQFPDQEISKSFTQRTLIKIGQTLST
jgi:hypothetical protein